MQKFFGERLYTLQKIPEIFTTAKQKEKKFMDIRNKKDSVTEKIFNIFELVFKISFLMYGLASFNSFFAQTKIISLLLILTTLCAGITLLYRLVNFRRFIHNKMLWLCFAFLASYAVSFVLNLQYANMNGIKTLAFMGMQFCLLVATDENKGFEDFKTELNLIFRIFSFYMMVAAFTSIILMFCGYSNITERNNKYILSGFVWGRLWGVFTDPNYAAVLSVMTIIISLYAIKKRKTVFWRTVNIINIILQVLYISFSDSRTGMVVAFVSLSLYICLRLSANYLKNGKLSKKIVCISMILIIVFIGSTSFKAINTIYNKTVSLIATAEKEPEEKGEQTIENNTVAGREQDLEKDISNRRFDLWNSAVETFKLRPVFGVSFESVVDFAEANLPDTYLINNDNGKFNNYHNVLFNVLVGQGIVGIVIFFAMIVYAGLNLIKTVYNSYGTKNYLLCCLLFTLLVAIFVSAMFISDIIYTISVNMMIFWYLLGIMLAKGREDINEYKNQRNNSCI